MLRQLSLALVLWLTSSAAGAFTLEPITRTFSPAGRGSQQSYQIVNDGTDPIAIEVTFVERQIDQTGTEQNQPADADFLAVPSQLVLAPGASQTLRVSWLGDPEPAAELAYRIVLEQLPIPLPLADSDVPIGQVRVLTNYRGSLFIKPEGVAPAVSFSEAIATSPDAIAVTLDNTGTAHARLKEPRLELTTSSGETLVLEGEALVDLDQAVILPGSSRTFNVTLPAAATITGGTYAGEF